MRTSFALLVASITVLFVASCQKEANFDPSFNPSTGGTPSGVTGNFKAKINGVQWTANKLVSAARMTGIINITGMGTDGKTVTMTLTDSGVHRYILSDVTLNAGALVDSAETNRISYTSNGGVYPTESGGEVNITSINTTNKTISGTFSFKLFRPIDGGKKTVTEGSFTNVTYMTTLPPAATTDTFRVKIDGTSWVPQTIMGSNVAGQLIITASNSTATKTVGFVLPQDITPGTYTLDFWGLTHIGQYNPDNDPMHSKASMGGSSSITVLEHNKTTKRIRANFAFKAEELLNANNFANLTEGYFSVKYQ